MHAVCAEEADGGGAGEAQGPPCVEEGLGHGQNAAAAGGLHHVEQRVEVPVVADKVLLLRPGTTSCYPEGLTGPGIAALHGVSRTDCDIT